LEGLTAATMSARLSSPDLALLGFLWAFEVEAAAAAAALSAPESQAETHSTKPAAITAGQPAPKKTSAVRIA
jgi:hypothetical protein